MADYNINADITADASGYEAGVKKAQKASKNLSKSIAGVIQGLGKNGLVGALGSVGLASAGLSATLGAVIKVARNVAKTIGECTEAYKKQYKAEIALSTVAKNNPYVNGTGVIALKNFASAMQKVTNYGDEELLPLMANLTALGRTEEETMKIMTVALDMSASGSMSLDTAITQLNATLNGSIGRLGQQNAELKGLTEEELKSGKAVEILGKKYEGLAKASVDSSKQLKNAIGDLRETLGQSFEKALNPMRKYFAELIQNWADARKARQDYNNAKDKVDSGSIDEENLQTVIDGNLAKLDKYKKKLESLSMTEQQALEAEAKNTWRWLVPSEEGILSPKQAQALEKETRLLQSQLRISQKMDQVAEERRKKQQENEQAEIQAEEEIVETLEEQESLFADIASWEDKLLQQSIDRLEVMKDIELSGAESPAQEYAINYKYSQQILQLKLEQLDRAKQAELEAVEGTENAEEARIKIIKYYDEQERLLRIQNSEMTSVQVKKQSKKDWKEIAKEATTQMKKAFDKIGKLAKTVGNVIKSIFSAVMKNAGKIFNFNVDDGLNALLKFEDAILTFFVETLPQLPAFLESVFQSINVLISSIDFEQIWQNLQNVLDVIISNAPQFISNLGDVLKSGIEGFTNFLVNNMGDIAGIIGQVLETIGDLIPVAIRSAIKLIASLLKDGLPVLLESLVKVIGTLVDSIPDLLREGIPELLNGVFAFLKSFFQNAPKIIRKLMDAMYNIVEGLLNGLCDWLANLSANDISDMISAIVSMVGDIASAIISNIGIIVTKLIPALIRLVFELIKKIPDILSGLLTGAVEGFGKLANSIVDGVKSVGSAVGGFVTKLFTGKLFANGTDNAPRGLAIVGEAGPELVNFRGGEQVLSNKNTQKALAGVGAGNTFNVTFNNLNDTSAYAMMSQLKAYNRQLSINGVI